MGPDKTAPLTDIALPKTWGTNRVGCNLMEYLDFTAAWMSVSKVDSAISYTYTASGAVDGSR